MNHLRSNHKPSQLLQVNSNQTSFYDDEGLSFTRKGIRRKRSKDKSSFTSNQILNVEFVYNVMPRWVRDLRPMMNSKAKLVQHVRMHSSQN